MIAIPKSKTFKFSRVTKVGWCNLESGMRTTNNCMSPRPPRKPLRHPLRKTRLCSFCSRRVFYSSRRPIARFSFRTSAGCPRSGISSRYHGATSRGRRMALRPLRTWFLGFCNACGPLPSRKPHKTRRPPGPFRLSPSWDSAEALFSPFLHPPPLAFRQAPHRHRSRSVNDDTFQRFCALGSQ